jgi:hypothetical protein
MVYAVGGGTTTITAASTVNPAFTASCTVTVVVPLTGITLNATSLAINRGAADVQLIVTYIPSDTTQTGITWSTGNSAIANVTAGLVHAVGPGSTYIRAESTADGSIFINCPITVSVPITGITLDQSSIAAYLGGADASLVPGYIPADTTQTGINWSSTNTTVATVTNGVVHFAAKGTTTIRATSAVNSTIYQECTITVSAYQTTVSLLVADEGSTTFTDPETPIVLNAGTNTHTITVTGEGFYNFRWVVDGSLKGTGSSIILNKSEYTNGGHFLSLEVYKNGIPWSKELTFTVQ